MRFINGFEELSKKDVTIAGGKGASLGEMMQAGIPVPPGFVVLSTTFDTFLKETDLDVEIEAALDAVNHKEIHTVENASEKIQALILEAEMPKDIADDIKKYFKKLGAKYVAVRSSATAEDSASAAWAGQLDSFLNTTEEHLLENVKKCWASLFTPRAIFYRFEKDLHKQKISVAVVVQKMVESEVSGIAFSVHPVTQDRNQLIIEAGFGLGEAIVSGQITPDSYVAEKEPFRIIDINVNEQTRGLYRAQNPPAGGGGNEWINLTPEKGKSQVLSEKEIKELSQIIIDIENHYGFPVDVEWAQGGGRFYIVQSRPITTLAEEPKDYPSASKEPIEYLHYKFPILPYYYSPAMWASKCKWENDYIIGEWFLRCNVTGDADVVVSSDQFSRYGDKFLDLLLNNEKIFTEYLFNLSKKIISTADFLEDINYKNLKYGDAVSLQDFYDKYQDVFSEAVGFGYSLDYSFDQYIKRKNISIHTKNKYPSFTKREQADLAKIATLQSSPRAIAISEHALKYSWLLNNYTGEHRVLSNYFENRLNEGIRKTERIDLKLEKPENFLDWVEFLTFIRDERKRLNLIAVGLMDRSISKICSDLQLSRQQVVMHTVEEIRKTDSTQFSSERYIKITHSGPVDQVPEIWEEEFKRTKAEEDLKEIGGMIANRGRVTGRVKIILSEKDFEKIKEGEIIVASMTRPEFFPILSLCSAIITNEGGITCHAAIISRELNIPCIIGTKFATQVLKDGDSVEVDADNGVVRILAKQDSKLET